MQQFFQPLPYLETSCLTLRVTVQLCLVLLHFSQVAVAAAAAVDTVLQEPQRGPDAEHLDDVANDDK